MCLMVSYGNGGKQVPDPCSVLGISSAQYNPFATPD